MDPVGGICSNRACVFVFSGLCFGVAQSLSSPVGFLFVAQHSYLEFTGCSSTTPCSLVSLFGVGRTCVALVVGHSLTAPSSLASCLGVDLAYVSLAVGRFYAAFPTLASWVGADLSWVDGEMLICGSHFADSSRREISATGERLSVRSAVCFRIFSILISVMAGGYLVGDRRFFATPPMPICSLVVDPTRSCRSVDVVGRYYICNVNTTQVYPTTLAC